MKRSTAWRAWSASGSGEYKDTHTRLVTVGVVLCVLAAVPLFAAMCIKRQRPALYRRCLRAAGAGGHRLSGLVTAGVYQGAMEQLLEEGDYTVPRKSTTS